MYTLDFIAFWMMYLIFAFGIDRYILSIFMSQFSPHQPSPAYLLKAFAVWLTCAFAYCIFEFRIVEPPQELWNSIIQPFIYDPNATWGLISHLAGFTCFMMLMTRQSRWLWIATIGGLSFLWICKLIGVPEEWWVFTTNMFGFVLMFISLVIGMGVFSSLYVFSHLISFIKRYAKRYPALAVDIRKHPLLKVVISDEELRGPSVETINGSIVIKRETSSECFLCKSAAVASVPVCSAWKGERISNSEDIRVVCTKFHTVKEQRDELVSAVLDARMKQQTAEHSIHALRIEIEELRLCSRRHAVEAQQAKEELERYKIELKTLKAHTKQTKLDNQK